MQGPRAEPSDFVGLDPSSGSEGNGVAALVDELVERMASAVPSYAGLTVTLVDEHGEITLTAAGPADEGPPQTSLGFSVVQADGRVARFVLLARQPGALIDLSADLDYLTRVATGRSRAPTDVRLDADLDGRMLVPGVVGLEQRSALLRAEGVLIAEGVDPRDATAELRRRAAADGTDLHTYARRTLAVRTRLEIPPDPRAGQGPL